MDENEFLLIHEMKPKEKFLRVKRSGGGAMLNRKSNLQFFVTGIPSASGALTCCNPYIGTETFTLTLVFVRDPRT